MKGRGLTPLEQQVLDEVTPTPTEEQEVGRDARDVEAAATEALHAEGLQGEARVQGSVAKGTWLRKGADLDLFLLLDPAVPASELDTVAGRVGNRVLEGCRRKYAQHPYVMGTFRGRAVDLVPAYRVASPGAKMSAVDRTPFHTEWVRARLDAALRGHVRLAKRWLKGTGTYGAQTAIGGFSGYLVEVLVALHGSFPAFLGWLEAGAKPRRLADGADAVHDDVSPLVVVDPVDPARNCAAAVTPTTLERAEAAARAYAAAPSRAFFFPAPPRAEAAPLLHDALQRRGEAWAGVLLRPATDRLDIVFPQFQRAARTLAGDLTRAGFHVQHMDVAASPAEDEILLQVLCTGSPLPERRVHRGPKDDGRPNAQRFREKWEAHPDRVSGPTPVEGYLQVEVAVRARTPAQWLAANLPTAALGRHAEDAIKAGPVVHADPAEAPAGWAPHVADVVLQRPPWAR